MGGSRGAVGTGWAPRGHQQCPGTAVAALRSLPLVSAVPESQQVFREASRGRIHRDKVKLFFPF